MGIEVVKKNASSVGKIETCDISNAQVWSNRNGTTLMTIPKAQDTGCYIVLVLENSGAIEHTVTMRTFELVNHLNRHSFEEINCTIELHF